MIELLSKDHTILERRFMEFVPFGSDERGDKIRDVSGVSVRAMVNYLETYVSITQGPGAGEEAVRELTRQLNERIRDPAYHVTPAFVKNTWHSYSYEFVCFVYEFCEKLSGDPDFAFNAGKQKISPIIQTLGRPFPVHQIYKMFSHFGRKYAQGCIEYGVGAVSERSAILRIRFTERSYRQFGPYRRRCAEMICKSHHGSLTAVPEFVHQLPPASIRDLSCIAEGDEWCEWELTWMPRVRRGVMIPWSWLGRRALLGASNGHGRTGRIGGARPEPASEPAASLTDVCAESTGAYGRSSIEEPQLLSKEHTILERPFMKYRPFGVNPDGSKIRDATGVKVRAFVDYLEEYMDRTRGTGAGEQAVQDLCRQVNLRISDPAYHVTPEFLKNVWNSYSYEFVCFLAELCKGLAGDPGLPFRAGEEKFISAVIQALGRPFTLQQIYSMFPHFGEKFSCLILTAEPLTNHSAILTMRYPASIYQQFGPYRRACAELVCQSARGALEAVPEKIHGAERAVVRDRRCVARGDECCEWEVLWTEKSRPTLLRSLLALLRDSADSGVRGRALPAPPAPGAVLPHHQRGVAPKGKAAAEGLSKEHTILERPFMDFRPFGTDERGEKIRDISGMIVRANVDQLELSLPGTAGTEAVKELCRLLNERIRDPVYHVTPAFLKNVWNSYSYEFVSYLRQFCEQLSGDTNFHYNVGKGQHLSPLIQILGRPFPVPKIYRMWPHFAQKFAKGSIQCRAEITSESSARLALRFSERTYQQFGPYRKACARLTCEASKGGIAMVPNRVHGLPAATVKDVSCIVNGDEWCEWEVTWSPQRRQAPVWPMGILGVTAAVFAYLRLAHPGLGTLESLLLALVPPALAAFAVSRRLRKEALKREALIQEQVEFVESRHEELREAYLEQEQTHVELRRKVNQLTTLHRTGLLFSSTLDRNTLIHNVLETIVRDLGYDRAMISFYDRARGVTYDARVLGVPPEAAALARSHEIPVSDPGTLEGEVLLRGRPVLVTDLGMVWDRLHPLNRELALATRTKSLISVPLKAKDVVLGSLTVDRTQEHSLTADDLELMVTLASQVAIALDNTEAYRQIEELNVGLEAKVRERTMELEKADRLRSLFLSHVSHELRTPLTSIKGFVENMLAGLTGSLAEKQEVYLKRVAVNADRLIRMIADLLDRTRIETGRMELTLSEISLSKCVMDVIEQLRPLAVARRQRLEAVYPSSEAIVWADADRLAQILTNLLDNAIKFTPEEGSVTIRVVPEGERFMGVCVEDTGKGIPAEALPKLFDPFFRVTQEQRGAPKGLGLGLSIVKHLVELHGGSIAVHSGVGQGTRFHFTVPVGPMAAKGVGHLRRGLKRLLVVDDDPDIQQFLLDRLGATGYQVTTASDGVGALEVFRQVDFDGMILDIGMPDLDGLEVLRQVRAQNPTMPVVMVTASGSKQRAVEAVSMGAQAYVVKPFDLTQLEQVVHRCFGKP